jgi:uncharacterized protein YjiS (DUF1127 family)
MSMINQACAIPVAVRRAPQAGLAGLFQQCVALLFRRMDRQRQRRDTHTLSDIGVSRCQAIAEGSKPFWR